MTDKHTPGPWTVARDCGSTGFLALHDSTGRKMALIFRDVRADAALIAAAPDMLAALQYIASCQCEDEGSEDHSDLYAAAREAIAKATGDA